MPLAAAFKPRTKAPAIVRFLHHADLSGAPDACWPYENSVHPAGYATVFDGRNQKAHRWAYEHFIGQIPAGVDVDHACCTEDCPAPGWGDPHRGCVNPRHLVFRDTPRRYVYDCTRCGRPIARSRPVMSDWIFCSMECRSGGRMVTKTCPVCGRDFTIPLSNEDRYQTCSMACKNIDAVYIDCARCGKRFAPRKNNAVRYCSEGCRRPPLMIACRTCGKEFRKSACEENKRFCSISCVRHFMGETQLEARVRVALEALGIGFTQEYPLRRWSIDFAIPKHRVAIEADGDYWHTILADRDAKRDAAMNAAGWTVVRLSETDVNNARDLGQLILTRVHAATGLEQADLVGPAQAGSRGSRSAPRQLRRSVSRPAMGQPTLWD